MNIGANFSSGSKKESPNNVAIKGPKNCSGPYLEPSGRCLSSEMLRKTIKGIDNNSKETQRGVSKINKSENSPRYGILPKIDQSIELSEYVFPNIVEYMNAKNGDRRRIGVETCLVAL